MKSRMLKMVVGVCVMFFSCLCLIGQIPDENQIYWDLHGKQMEAQKARSNKDYAKALEILDSVVASCKALDERTKDSPDRENIYARINDIYSMAYLQRGYTLKDMGRRSEAIESYTLALYYIPHYRHDTRAGTYHNRALAEERIGDIRAALIDYLVAFSEESNESMYLVNRADLWTDLGEFERAFEDLDIAISLDPQYDYIFYRRGTAKRLRGDISGALNDLNRAIELDSKNEWFLQERARVHLSLGNYSDAISDYTKALEIDPELKTAYAGRAFAYFANKNYKKTSDDFRKARTDSSITPKSDYLVKPLELVTEFNELEYAIVDPQTNSIVLVGRENDQYKTGPIPYYDLLQTAWSLSVDPNFSLDARFSLDTTPESYANFEKILAYTAQPDWIRSMSARLKENKDSWNILDMIFGIIMAPPARQSKYINPEHRVDFSGGLLMEFVEMLNITDEVSTILMGQGTKEVHEQIFSKLGLPKEMYTHLPLLRDITGQEESQEKLFKLARLLPELRKILGLSPDSMKLQRAASENDAETIRVSQKELASNLGERFGKVFQVCIDRGDLTIGPNFCSLIFTDAFEAKLRFINIPATSQVARILFEADYCLKFLTNETLKGIVPGHMTSSQWIYLSGEPRRQNHRFWLSPEVIEIEQSQDEGVLRFTRVSMRIDAMREDKSAPGSERVGAITEYAKRLTKNYDLYAQVYPPLYELKETCKIFALARLLRAKGIKELPYNITHTLWDPPVSVDGQLSFYVTPRGEKTDLCNVTGGVNLNNLNRATAIRKSPTLPKPEEIVFQEEKEQNHGLKVKVAIKDTIKQGVMAPGKVTQATIKKLGVRQKFLEKHTAWIRSQIENLREKNSLDAGALEKIISIQLEDADQMFEDSLSLLLGSLASAKVFGDKSRELLKAKWIRKPSHRRMWRKAGRELLEENDGPIMRVVEKTGEYIDYETVSKIYERGRMLDVAQKTLEGKKSYLEAQEEMQKFLADEFLDVLWDERTNPRYGGPKKAKKAVDWALTFGRVSVATSFLLDAKDYIDSVHQFYDHNRVRKEILNNIDNSTGLMKALSEQYQGFSTDFVTIKEKISESQKRLKSQKKK